MLSLVSFAQNLTPSFIPIWHRDQGGCGACASSNTQADLTAGLAATAVAVAAACHHATITLPSSEPLLFGPVEIWHHCNGQLKKARRFFVMKCWTVCMALTTASFSSGRATGWREICSCVTQIIYSFVTFLNLGWESLMLNVVVRMRQTPSFFSELRHFPRPEDNKKK